MGAESRYSIARTLLALVLAALSLTGVGAGADGASPKGARPAEKLASSFVWHDGQQVRNVWLNPQLLVEFDPAQPGEQLIRREWPKAHVLAGDDRMRLWDAGEIAAMDVVTKRLNTLGARLSPVLHDTASGQGRKRALPGNIIVYLDPRWDDATVQSWFSKRGLAVLRPLPIAPNVFLVASAPGLASLTLANSLVQSGDVIAAFPDWWQEVVPR